MAMLACGELETASPQAVRPSALGVFFNCASAPWIRLRQRASELAAVLGYQILPSPSRWSALTATGARNYLHLLIVLIWFALVGRNPSGNLWGMLPSSFAFRDVRDVKFYAFKGELTSNSR